MRRLSSTFAILSMTVIIWGYGEADSLLNSSLWLTPAKRGLSLQAESIFGLFVATINARTFALFIIPICLFSVYNNMAPSHSAWITRHSRKSINRWQTLRLLQSCILFSGLVLVFHVGIYWLFMNQHVEWSWQTGILLLVIAATLGIIMMFWSVLFQCVLQLHISMLQALLLTYGTSLAWYFIGENLLPSVWTPTKVFTIFQQVMIPATVGNHLHIEWGLISNAATSIGVTLIFTLALILIKSELALRKEYY